MKKTLLTLAALVLALGATSLMANSDWAGTFTGDDTGTWTGTITDQQDPPKFNGEWASSVNTDYGTLVGILEYDGAGVYKVLKGKAYDQKGIEIGAWSGTFNVTTDPGHAKGVWSTPDGLQMGAWIGQTVD